MLFNFRLEGQHVNLCSEEDITYAIRTALDVFDNNKVDPSACAAAYSKLEKDELLTHEEALLCVIWNEADDRAFEVATHGWLSTDVDIRLVAQQAA